MLVAEEAVEIRVLTRQGKSIREIARTLDVSRNTVRRCLRFEGLPRYQRPARPGKLDAYKHYLEERVKAAAPDWIPAPWGEVLIGTGTKQTAPLPCGYQHSLRVYEELITAAAE